MDRYRQGISALVAGISVVIHFGIFPAVGYEGVLREYLVFIFVMVAAQVYYISLFYNPDE